jgi:putative isomerase
MLNYGYTKEAEEMCKCTLLLLGKDIENTGSLHEYYDPYTGKPIMNSGFINWNILALNMVKELESVKLKPKH